MFARATIFAISALVMTTNGAPAQSTCTNTVANSCPSANFALSSACECCPVGDECDDTKFFGQFCVPDPLDPKAPKKLDVLKLPLSCTKRQAIQTTCTNTCKSFEIRQDNCECCPVVGYECTHFDIGGATDYCDGQSKLIKERLAPSCPQRQTTTAPTCTTTCNADWEVRNTLCECCPKTGYTCAAGAQGTDIAGFKLKYCQGTAFLTTAFAPSCAQPTVSFDVSTCTTECQKYTYRSLTSCDCCPNIGEECKYGDLFCTNNKADSAKIPIACGAKVQPLCSKFCPTTSLISYTLGANCDCCPVVGQECGPQYQGQYCDTSNPPNIVPSKIPDGCPIKDLFLKECKDSSNATLVCPANTFKTSGCGCCPVVGKECDSVYSGAYCNGNVLDINKLHQSCPQRLNFKDCSKFTCPPDFTKNDKCECCPPVGLECLYGFCDSAGLFIRIPDGCPQTKAALSKETQCDSTKYFQLLSNVKSFQYVNSDCQICPVVGKECEGDNQALFCVSIAGFNTPDLSRIPSRCPQVLAQSNCPANLYTKNLIGECCPLKGKERNAEYGGKYSTPDGKLIYSNIPAGCPQYEVVAGCSCSDGYITPAGATNCECCPFPGFECDKRYNGKFCDVDGNLILTKLEAICRPTQQQCDARYYFTGKDGFTCCPFEGKECEPVYGSKYCSTELGNAPWRQTVDPTKIPQVCKASSKQNTCSSRFVNQNGQCCPLKGYECSVYYDNNQFCTNGQIDYSKIPFGCSQFEDVCLGANFEKSYSAPTVFKACCPKVANNALTVANLCTDTKFGAVDGKGGLFCDKDGAVLPEVISVCSAAAGAGTTETTCGTDQTLSPLKYTFFDGTNKHCCPLSGFECIGSNKAMYCNEATGDIKNAASRLLAAATNVPFVCPGNKNKITGATLCNQASANGKDLVIKQNKLGVISDPIVCAQCPLIGKECTDDTNFPYTDNKNAYCSRAFKTGSTTEYEYTLNIMSIDKLCPQRINGFSRIVATHFVQNAESKVYCPTSFAQGLGAFYSTFANSAFTLSSTLIPACDATKLTAETCAAVTACPEQHYRIKTGGATAAEQCLCCPNTDKDLCDPIFNNRYCLNNALISGAVPDQCNPPSTTSTRNQYFQCPKGVACGEGWVNSSQGCDCCPDFATKYTDAWCQGQTAASELSDILCSTINGANGKKRPAMDVAKLIPQSCTKADTTNFPPVSVIDIVTRTGVQCPRIGTECDSTRVFTPTTDAFCTSDADSNTVLNIAKIPVGCDQKTSNTGVCPVDACDRKYITVPDKDFPTKAQYCQCCPKIGFECDPIYNNEFCDPITKAILYEKIPSSCDQQKQTNACNFEFFFKNYKGSCCPIEGKECLKQLGGFFCNFDGSFKKEAFETANCDVPKCLKTCENGFLQNGCYCCPVPFFELDEFYNGSYTGFDGTKNIPEECMTLNLFPKNPWDVMITFKSTDYQAAKTVEGLLPIGTLEGYKYVLNVTDVKDVFRTNISKPAATLKDVMSKNIDYKINWATKGRVFGVNQINQIYTILNTPTLVTAIDAQIVLIEAAGYVAVPPTLWSGLAVADQAAFKLLTQAEKRYRFVTFWFNKPINECSKFGQQDRFYLGETNWLPTTLTLDTAKEEYTLSKLIEELTYPKELTVEALLKVTRSQNISITNYLQLDKVNRAYRMVKANLPTTFDAAWHTTNQASATINTFETFFKSSVYWFDAKYPGLQVPPVVTGETAPTNAARAAVYTSYMSKIEPSGAAVVVDTTDSDFSKPFEQYRMNYYMDLAVKEYVATNPTWDPQAYALKYSDATLTDYVYPVELKLWLRSSELNKIMDMVKQAEGWLVKYAAFLPATPTLEAVFAEKILGSVLNKIGINIGDIQATAGANKYSFKQALFVICAYLDKNGLTLSDVYVPEYPTADLDQYYLSSAVIQGNNFSTRDVAFIYEGAKLIETDLGLANQLTNRNADLLVAFEGSAEKLAAATTKEKAGRLMYLFYQKTRGTVAKEVSGVIRPQPFSRYFFAFTDNTVKAGFTASKVSERDLFTGNQNAFSIALKVQTEIFKADIAATSAWIDGKYPQLKLAINADATLDTNDKKAEAYAYYVATADIGLKPRKKSELDKYFPGASQSYLTRAKISEKDLDNIDQKVTAASIASFRFNNDLVTKLGITPAPTGADAQEIVLRVNAAREYAEERIAYYEKLYKLPILDHLRELGVTADMLSDINLSFDQVAKNPEQWNTELIGNMLFSQSYGKICKPALVYNANCITGWQSPKAVAEITIPLGLTQQIAMTKQYSLLEVMNLSRQYISWTGKDARKTNNIQQLAVNTTPNVNVNLEFVKNYFDGEFLSANDLVTRGYVCQTPAGTTGQTEKLLFVGGPKICDYLSNSANTDVYRDKSRAETIVAPKTNIDIMRNSFKKQFTKANFDAVLGETNKAANQVATADVNADYDFGNFMKAAAQFPAFCSVEDNKQDTVSCEKQIIGLLAVVGHYSSGFKDSLKAATTGCSSNNDNSCLNVPPVETLEYHYISKLMKNSDVAIENAIYKAWGMGKISGPREFLEFFSRYPEVSDGFTGFTKPIQVTNLLTAAPEMNWATAFYRWFQPSKVNFEKEITESQDIGTGAKKYFYVEDSYLVPSFDTLMLGISGDFSNGATDFLAMFPTSQNGFRGIMKVLLGENCHSTAGGALTKTASHTKLGIIFDALVAQWKSKDATIVDTPYNENKDCSAVGMTASTANIPNIPKFNRKNYYAPTVTTVEPAPFFTVRQFQGTPGQCFNVHIETPYSIFSQDAYAKCVAIKMLSTYGMVPTTGAAFDFTKYPKFKYYF